jgi:hypothetical protein
MKKLLFLFFLSNIMFSQVGIGTTTPDASSSLDIDSTDSGLLIPRVSLIDVSDSTNPINAPSTSLLVYNTNIALTGGNGVGYYYWNGIIWVKLQISSDEKWIRNSAFGSLSPATISDNIGIGTSTPSDPLTVKSTSLSNIATFDGDNQMYITFAENGINRGYIGSYFGNPEDVNFGNYGGTTGSVHLTTNNQARVTATNDGNVGIGTTNPTEKLDIDGKIKITDGTEGIGKVLVSNAAGVGSWVTTNSIKSAISGVFIGSGANIGGGTPVGGGGSPAVYCQTYIDLPPGRWLVFGTYLLLSDQFSSILPLVTGDSVWVRCIFSSSDVVYTSTTDVISGGLISGVLSGPNEFGLANGQTIIQNPNPQGGATKRYYMWSSVEKYGTTPTDFYVSQVGGTWGENQLTAIPMN